MLTFVYNIAISLWVFGCFFLSGLGFACALLPAKIRKEAFLLAPLIGLCLAMLVALFELTVLLKPLTVELNFLFLQALSLLLCLRFKPHFSLQDGRASFVIAPLLLFPLFAWLFHREGFHLLVAGSDQLQYCLNAKQMLEVMHQHTHADFPLPRYDHIIYDMATKNLPYERNYRRGAELLLAMTKVLSGLSYAKAFPVLVLNGLVSMGLALAYLGRQYLSLSRLATVVLQGIFLSSFYFFLLQAQGSLALILGLAPGLLALAALTRLFYNSTFRDFLLAVFWVASYLSIYVEPALMNLFFPAALLGLWRFYQLRFAAFTLCGRLLLLLLAVTLVSPFAMEALVFNAKLNILDVVLAALHPVQHAQAVGSALSYEPWNLAPVVLGLLSYYDPSSFNGHWSAVVAKAPWLGLLLYSLLVLFSSVALLCSQLVLARVYALLLLFWFSMSLTLFGEQDLFRYARSLHYALPFAFIGLAFMVEYWFKIAKERQAVWSLRLYAAFSLPLLILLVLANFYTDARTLRYLSTTALDQDSRVLRFDEQGPEWLALKAELVAPYPNSQPILFSGFRETVRPLAVASLLADQPQVMGRSLMQCWSLYKPRPSYSWSPLRVHRYDLNSWVSEQALDRAQAIYYRHYETHQEEGLIRLSEKAIVPEGQPYPEEWQDSQDVYAAFRVHFPNIGDVVYRHRLAVSLPQALSSALKQDAEGKYRELKASGPILVKACPKNEAILLFAYQGPANAVTIQKGEQVYQSLPLDERTFQIRVPLGADDCSRLSLNLKQRVKLRRLSWLEQAPH